MSNKICPKCENELPIESFYRNRSARDGRSGYCRTCANRSSLASYKKRCEAEPEYKERRSANIAARRRELYRTDEEYRTKVLAAHKERYMTNEEFRAKTRAASKERYRRLCDLAKQNKAREAQ